MDFKRGKNSGNLVCNNEVYNDFLDNDSFKNILYLGTIGSGRCTRHIKGKELKQEESYCSTCFDIFIATEPKFTDEEGHLFCSEKCQYDYEGTPDVK